jgi:transcriptional regulator with XRE-family HTH domain
MVDRRRSRARAALYRSPSYLAVLERVAVNLRNLREAQELTQEEAAAKAEMGLRLWQAIETASANVTMLTLARICDGLGTDCSKLFARVANPGAALERRRGRPSRRVPR